MLAHFGHVRGHDAVAPLGHCGDLGTAPIRRHAEPEESNTQRSRDFLDLRKMRHEFRGGLVHALDRRARKLELAAWLERNRAAAGHLEQTDYVAVLDDRLPAEQILHAFEQRADAAAAIIGDRAMTLDREHELLVLGTEAKL